MNEILDLGGRVALVTGTGQGVGRQIAMQLAATQNSGGVAVNDYYLERAQSVVEEITKAVAARFMRSNARPLGRYMITANCIAIGMTVTPAIDAA